MLETQQREKLTRLALALIDQEQARIIITAEEARSGFWFGGGNMTTGPDGALYLTGRYRSAGDSRTGLAAGERGKALVIWRSADHGATWEQVLRFDKQALSHPDQPVLSIEGAALHFTRNGVELFVSSEKDGIGYPDEWASYQKPDTGVWTIDQIIAPSVQGLATAPINTIGACRDPRWLHVKDPFFTTLPNGDLWLGFCTHPFNWSSSNTGYMVRPAGEATFQPATYDFFPRGFTWDVAISRLTSILPVPLCGTMAACEEPLWLGFYDGGECMRNLDEHKQAASRPRGYSCEELGGVAVLTAETPYPSERLSIYEPLLVSLHGTGCSRYVDVLAAPEGFYATWQQSQPDGSQPLVMHFLGWDRVTDILT